MMLNLNKIEACRVRILQHLGSCANCTLYKLCEYCCCHQHHYHYYYKGVGKL